MLSRLREAYRSALVAMSRCGLDVCPATGDELQASLGAITDSFNNGLCVGSLVAADQSVQAHLQEWGRSTSRHYQETAGELKEILIMMAQTAESLGARDHRGRSTT